MVAFVVKRESVKRESVKAPKKKFAYAFEAPLEVLMIGNGTRKVRYLVVNLPAQLQRKAPFSEKKRLRMRGTIDGHEVARAWQVAHGRHYMMIGATVVRTIGAVPGQRLAIAFDVVSNDDVAVPKEITEACDQEPAWRELWSKLRAPDQRRLVYLVESVRSPELRAQRAVDVMRGLEDGVVPGPPPRRR